jgi:hypothetical protein
LVHNGSLSLQLQFESIERERCGLRDALWSVTSENKGMKYIDNIPTSQGLSLQPDNDNAFWHAAKIHKFFWKLSLLSLFFILK